MRLIAFALCGVVAARKFAQPAHARVPAHGRRLDTTERFAYDTAYTTVTEDRRTNLCDRASAILNGSISYESGVSGLELHFWTSLWDPFILNCDADEQCAGLVKYFIDEVARSAGFSYTLHFHHANGSAWTDVLVEMVTKYDLALDYWIEKPDRISRGASTASEWIDSSLVMVQYASKSETSMSPVDMMLLAFKPFHVHLWIAIFATVLLSGVLYHIAENLNQGKELFSFKDLHKEIWQSLFEFASATYPEPTSPVAQWLLLAYSFFVLLVVISFTGAVTAQLVTETRITGGYRSPDDAIRHDARVCLTWGFADFDLFQNACTRWSARARPQHVR